MTTTKRILYIQFRILLPPTIISIIVFAIFCFLSYWVTKDGQFNFKIGFPYKFYEQFRLSDGDTNNWGWTPFSLIIDIILTWTLSVGGYFIWLIKFYKPKKKESTSR
jgi:hypothetical protein